MGHSVTRLAHAGARRPKPAFAIGLLVVSRPMAA
jgi:hypothetical protein